jgi:hypothetical protein
LQAWQTSEEIKSSCAMTCLGIANAGWRQQQQYHHAAATLARCMLPYPINRLARLLLFASPCPLTEIVDMLQPGQINNQQVEAAFSAFASVLAAADARRKQRNTVRQRAQRWWGCAMGTQHIVLLMLAGCGIGAFAGGA